MIEILFALLLGLPGTAHAFSPTPEVAECMSAENPGEECAQLVNEFIESQQLWTEEQEQLLTEPVAKAAEVAAEAQTFWQTLLEGPLGFMVWLFAFFG